MAEPFTREHCYIPALDNNKRLIHQDIYELPLLKERTEYIISVLMAAEPTQPLIMKVFFYEYIIPYLDEILSALKVCGFEFLILKRIKEEDQLISLGVAESTNDWNSNDGKGILNSSITITQKTIEKIHWLHGMLSRFDNTLKTFNLEDSPVIHYETAVEDLSTVLRIPINTRDVILKKQIISDPYQFITNADEVKQLIKRLINEK
jgi:hypothetical protein